MSSRATSGCLACSTWISSMTAAESGLWVEVLEHSQGTNFLTMHVAAFDPDFPGDAKCQRSKCLRHVDKKVVYAACDCIVTPQMEQLRRDWNCERLLPCLADIPRIGDRILRGQPVVSVIAEGSSDEEVKQILKERISAVNQALSSA
jgi:predicted ATP-grasp superfamily ATP-dependent carboligase